MRLLTHELARKCLVCKVFCKSESKKDIRFGCDGSKSIIISERRRKSFKGMPFTGFFNVCFDRSSTIFPLYQNSIVTTRIKNDEGGFFVKPTSLEPFFGEITLCDNVRRFGSKYQCRNSTVDFVRCWH